MSDRAYENAVARRESVQTELSDVEKRLYVLRGELRDIDNFLELWRRYAGEEAVSPVPAMQSRRNSKKEEVAEAAYDIIRERGEPMARSELFKRLIERGMVLNGSDPEMVLSTMLWRMRNRIQRLKKGGYWLADVQFKGAGEDPYFANPEMDEAIGTIDNTPPPEMDGDLEDDKPAAVSLFDRRL